jgi:drug/metabolite transporter (DMT)-like permease
MTAAGLVFTVMFALVKATRAQLGAFDVVFWRGLAAGVVAYALALHGAGSISVQRRALLAVRTLFGFAAMSCSFAAAKELGVGDLLLIAKMQPLLIAILAPALLGEGEREDPLQIAAVVLHFGTISGRELKKLDQMDRKLDEINGKLSWRYRFKPDPHAVQ